MQITLFGLLVVTIGIWCQFRRFDSVIVTLFGLSVFGAVSALDLPAIGGASVTPANMFLVFYLLRLVSMRRGMSTLISAIGPRRPLFLFLLLIVWISGSAMFLPRLFAGMTQVFSLTRTIDGGGGTTPLGPTSGNISQAVYAIGGFLVAAITSVFARKPGGRRVILTGIVFVTSLHILFAVVDLVTSATHTGFLLDLIHTGAYAFLTDDELGGLKRLSGSFSEASAFAAFSLTLLGVNGALFIQKIRPLFTGVASVLLIGSIILSTSSAGYAGLVVVLGAFMVHALATGLILRQRRVLSVAFGMACTGILVIGVVVLFLPKTADVAQTVVNQSLINKAGTDSALERGSWNAQAWQVFLDTDGLGAGIGATRSSNYVMVLLSNLGVIGFCLFTALILRLTATRISAQLGAEDRSLIIAARVGIVTSLIPSLLIGTVYDLGTLFYCLVGLAASGIETATNASATIRGISNRRMAPALSQASLRSCGP